MGVPVIGCRCSVCLSSSPKDRRLRSSGLLTIHRKKILFDCGPDFRQQALLAGIGDIDGVVITHAHYDHIAGVDELRAYSMKREAPIPCLLSQESADDLTTRFDYLFQKRETESFVAKMELQVLPAERGELFFEGVKFRYFTYKQAKMAVNGFRVENFAYVTDISTYPPTIYDELEGVDELVLSALRFTPSPLHFTVDQAVDFAHKVGAKRCWLTHIAHDLQHERTNAYLPPNVRMAYDGLEIDIR